MKQKSKIKTLLVLILAFAMAIPQGFVFATTLDTVAGFGMDTVAGFRTTLRTSQTYPYKDVVFTLQKPFGEKVFLPSKTDANGIAKFDLSDFHTRKAGQYKVSAQLENSGSLSEATTFSVYPDKFSAEKSNVVIDKNVAKSDGRDEASLTVFVSDSYGNGLKGHAIQVVSSRPEDSVKAQNRTALTDADGKVVFRLTSGKAGLSTYSVVNVTVGQIFPGRVNVAYLDHTTVLRDVGGEFSPWVETARAAPETGSGTTGALHHFDIAGLPETIQPNQSVNFTVTAKDETNKTVQSYMGKVHFSSGGTNGSSMTLPEDYTFKADDLGTHQFSLGLSFKMAGNYKIIVTDLVNVLIKGTKDVVVSSTKGASDTSTSSQKPTIESPVAGAYSQKTQAISGKAPSGMTVKIFDNQVEVGSTQADTDGKFNFQIPSLIDGEHNVYVVTVDSAQTVKGTSSTVTFTIDTTPPKIDQVELDPKDAVKPLQSVKVKVYTEEKLSQAAIVFNSNITQLTADIDKPNIYTGSLQAPGARGVYPIDVILVDQLGNEGSYKASAQVTVGDTKGAADSSGVAGQTKQTQSGFGIPPAKVTGVIAYSSDKRVTLVWDAVSGGTSTKYYNLYYGLDANVLDRSAKTKDAGTTWYIPNLDNGKTYYFAVTAVDASGAESAVKSDSVTGSPFPSEVNGLLRPELAFGSSGDTLRGAAFAQAVPPRTTESGPEVLWLLGGSGIIAEILRRMRKKAHMKI